MKKNIKILYVASLCSKATEKCLFQIAPQRIGLQIQKYHRLLAEGFKKNGCQVRVVSYHPGLDEVFAHRKRINEIEQEIEYRYVISPAKKVSYLKVLFHSFREANAFISEHNSLIICDVLNISLSYGIILATKINKQQVIGIITDFPEQLFGKTDLRTKIIWHIIENCSGYIILTKQMKQKLNPHKPALVLEGHVDVDMKSVDNCLCEKYPQLVCLYAGMLHRKYGIETLVNAFLQLNHSTAELHIYGDGDYAEALKKINSKRIKYYGIVPNEKVIEEERRASLLINPRPSNEEFTKFSFPSKNMEYMASGTPLLTTRLPGMPKDYYPYVYLFDGDGVDDMRESLDRVLSIDRLELHKKGICAKEFILKEKNNMIQANRILDYFMDNCFEEK